MSTEYAIMSVRTAELSMLSTGSDHNPALVYLAGLSESSRRPMGHSLRTIADLVMPGSSFDSFPWGNLRYQHTQAIRSRLEESGVSAATANRHLSALRGVLKEAWRLGYMPAEDYQRAIDLKPVKGSRASQAEKGRHIQAGELRALLQTCNDGSKAGARDSALIALGYTCGLRRAELAALQVSDWNETDCTLTVRRGKGNKERIVPVAPSACDALADWLDILGREPGAIFVQIRKGDHVTNEGLTDHAVYHILAERAKQAGVKEFSPHDLRRTFAGDLLDTGADIATVQKLMGHANVNTTAGYDRRDAKAKRSAVNRLHIPYQKKG